MQLTHGRLKAALIAGKIPVTDQALTVLQAGLVTIARGYHLNKVLRAVKTPTELRKELSRLYQACRTFLDVLDADLKGLGQFQALLSDIWQGGQLARVVGDLRAVYSRLEMAILMVEQEQAKTRRPGSCWQCTIFSARSQARQNRELLVPCIGSQSAAPR